MLTLILAGCGSPSNESDSIPMDPSDIVIETLLNIHSDLKKLKTDFPQLSDIETAEVTNNKFVYSKGIVKRSKAGFTFMEDSCEISFSVDYPFIPSEPSAFAGYRYLKLRSGKVLRYGKLIYVEKTEEAARAKNKIDHIISENVTEMLERLGHKPEDIVRKYPNAEQGSGENDVSSL